MDFTGMTKQQHSRDTSGHNPVLWEVAPNPSHNDLDVQGCELISRINYFHINFANVTP